VGGQSPGFCKGAGIRPPQDVVDFCLQRASVGFGRRFQLFEHNFVKISNQYVCHDRLL
jgi:hypothetical protein